MTQPPPDMAAHEEELRRRLEAANGPSSRGRRAAPYVTPEDGVVAEQGTPERGGRQVSTGGPRARVTLTWAIAATVLVGMVGVVAAVIVPAINAAREPMTVERALEEGPPFAAKLTAAQTNDAYLDMWADGSIFAYVPENDDGRRYFKAFAWATVDYVTLDIVTEHQKPGDHKELIELERRFLAGEDLEVDLDITLSDGTRFVDDGSAPDQG